MSPLPGSATVPLLRSVPGLAHGFERRAVEGETREATRARVSAGLAGVGRLHLLSQVHGAVVREAPWQGRPEGDAAVTAAPGVLLGIETADCMPVLLVDPVARRVAAAHAGWRGTAAGVVVQALRAMTDAGSRIADILVALGPAIGACCYEVGDELRAVFGAAGACFFTPGPRGRPHLDVRAANRAQLERAGISPERIADLAECTACRADLYHSYRRDGPGGGRMISFVGWSG